MDLRARLWPFFLILALLAGLAALLARSRSARLEPHPAPIRLGSIDEYICYYRQAMQQSQNTK